MKYDVMIFLGRLLHWEWLKMKGIYGWVADVQRRYPII